MGFEDYCVLVCSKQGSPLWRGCSLATLAELSEEIMTKWPEIHPDDLELAHLPYRRPMDQVFLVYETPTGLFQMAIYLSRREQNCIVFSLRFAYCNPRSVYDPFCAVTEWLMQRYNLYCCVMRDLAPEQEGLGNEIDDIDQVRAILVPSMDYNRRFWQMDARTEEEAVLRPGEAMARFITPQLITPSSETTTIGSYVCPVCGSNSLFGPAYDNPGAPSYEICPCCGTEFGNDDFSVSHEVLRQRWLDNGARWWSEVRPAPPDWSAAAQLKHAGLTGHL